MESYGFFDTEELIDGTYDREYVAEQWADYFKLFIGNGVFPSPTNQLQVMAYSGMNVKLSAGWAFINGYWYHNDSDMILQVQPNKTANTRIDGVFIRWDSSSRTISAVIEPGRTAVNRTAPYYELRVAQIVVSTSATSIIQSNITDTRANANVCGFVSGVVDVIDSTTLFNQFTDIFERWFENIKGQLDEDAAGHLQNEIDELQGQVNGLDELKTEVNELENTVSELDTDLNKKVSELSVSILAKIDDLLISENIRTYPGFDLAGKFADEISNFDNVWAWLNYRVSRNNTQGIRTKDYITFQISGETYQARILGINTYKDATQVRESSPSTRTASSPHIDFMTQDCYKGQAFQWNTNRTNNGTASQKNPFMASNIHSKLNSIIYPLLPSELRAVIKEKFLYVPMRYDSSEVLKSDVGLTQYAINLGNLWLPFEGELTSHATLSTQKSAETQPYEMNMLAGLRVYELAEKSLLAFDKRAKNFSPVEWPTASAVDGNSETIVVANFKGGLSAALADNSFYVPICFRV